MNKAKTKKTKKANIPKKDANNKKTKISIIRLIVFLVFLVVFARIIFGFISMKPKTETVKQGTVELTENATGYIILDETVIFSPVSGQLNKLVKEGTRVKKDTGIISIDQNSSIKKENINALNANDKEGKLEADSFSESIFENDIEKIDQYIQNDLSQAFNISNTGNIEQLSKLKTELNSLLSKKKIISGNADLVTNNKNSKDNKNDEYQNYSDSSVINVPTSISGIVSYNIDGFENVISIKNLENVSPQSLQSLSTVENTSDVAVAGKPVVKIINNFEWYIACILDKNAINPLEEKDNVYLEFDNKDRVMAKVNNINLKDGSQNAVVVFRLTNKLENYYRNRKINIKIIKRSFEGVKVSLNSLSIKNNINGVYVVDNGVIVFREVDILGKDDHYAIIPIKNQLSREKGLSTYDELIVNPSRIKEGKLIK